MQSLWGCNELSVLKTGRSPCGWSEGNEGDSEQYEGREVSGCREEPGFYPEGTREPWRVRSRRRMRSDVRFYKAPQEMGCKQARVASGRQCGPGHKWLWRS